MMKFLHHYKPVFGSEHGGEGVKLEEQLVVTKNGYQLMSTFPFGDEFLD
tara:strand:- start:6 stop:152 length:147 start_codon:yes stop_codon:yes gene_type:complete